MASLVRPLAGFRSSALRIIKPSFTCTSCLRKEARHASPLNYAVRRLNINHSYPRRTSVAASISEAASISKSVSPEGSKSSSESSRKYPEISDKKVAYWLIGSAASVFGIVVFGGLTRLTESGLSITEWRPVTGSLPPTSQEAWTSEYDKYRSSPEFQRLNPNMSLEEFKKIYWMEWGHRLWGRVIGVSFLLPTMYFIARRRISPRTALRLTAISGLIGLQGFVGWWMVKSGLKDDLFAPGSYPRVSQYRLTVHLGLAFVVYALMLTSGLRILRAHRLLKSPADSQKLLATLRSPVVRHFRIATAAVAALVFTTAMSGALVAGLDAGLIYNEFPYMGLGLTPPSPELWDPHYSQQEDQSDLVWRNMTANPSLVQLDHRILAMTTTAAVFGLWVYGKRRGGRLRAMLPRDVHRGLNGLTHLVMAQVTLGITTLLYLVPTWLAAGHQAGSLALLTGALVLRNRLGVSSKVVNLVKMKVKQGGKGVGGRPVMPLRKS
ncbi:cytochrome oxidase assembly protein [Eremomyces bilateralis CBS 781.70]|uniref:Cytochrome oxidase assembly protein n=1 Tax=Eremomyces bilateralis CBS 781.70 TaxID=1392243 RepID=A0A6G1FU51_9PEZI|nr:cytochrome oxidase assembly protein [Eremomyces bilateralis CBS 781.70]KAF1809304.1 cytochrome oxidase assembly protein [Eremomyces bilateralis CBS 781.70]